MGAKKIKKILPADADAASADEQLWAEVCVRLRDKMNQVQFRQWVAPLTFAKRQGRQGGHIVLFAPTKFLANWSSDHYGAVIKKSWESVLSSTLSSAPKAVRVDIICPPPEEGHALETKSQQHASSLNRKQGFFSAGLTHHSLGGLLRPSAAQPNTTPLNENMRFDNFVSGQSNLLAYKTALSWSEDYLSGKNEELPSPLFICGSIGQGKTHLLHAIAGKLRQPPEKNPPHKRINVVNLTADRFRSNFVNAVRQNKMHDFKQGFSEVDVLLMDDVHFLSGEHTQKELIQILNLIGDRCGKVVVASTQPPSQLEGVEELVRSRLGGGLVVDIYPSDQTLRQDIIRAKLRTQFPPVQFPPEMVKFLAENITNSIRELEGALNRIIAHTRHLGKTPDTSHARLILRDLLQAPLKQISVSDIQKKTAEYFDISLQDLLSARRQRAIARPRQIAMYLAKQLTPRSLPDIGRRFGGRDHTTVLHALHRIEELSLSNASVQKDVANLKALCQSNRPSPPRPPPPPRPSPPSRSVPPSRSFGAKK